MRECGQLSTGLPRSLVEAGLITDRAGYSVVVANNMAEALLSCAFPQGYLIRFPPRLTCLKFLIYFTIKRVSNLVLAGSVAPEGGGNWRASRHGIQAPTAHP